MTELDTTNCDEFADAYDEITCVSAGELRAQGYPIPEDIPDCGWIPRGSMKMEKIEAKMVEGVVKVNAILTFTEPFRWVQINLKLDKEKAHEGLD